MTALPKQLRKGEETTIKWLSLVQDRLGLSDPEDSFVALRAVLHALRDRLIVEEAADFASQMPILLKGVFFDGWRPAKTPETYRDPEYFLARVQRELRDYMDAEQTTRGICEVLQMLIGDGQIKDVKNDLPKEIQAFFG